MLANVLQNYPFLRKIDIMWTQAYSAASAISEEIYVHLTPIWPYKFGILTEHSRHKKSN